MSFGNSPLNDAGTWSYKRHEKLVAQADADRAARLAGRKSPFRRLLDRLRPHRQEPGGDPQGNYGATDDPPH